MDNHARTDLPLVIQELDAVARRVSASHATPREARVAQGALALTRAITDDFKGPRPSARVMSARGGLVPIRHAG